MSDTITNDEELQITAPEHSLPPCALEELPEVMQQVLYHHKEGKEYQPFLHKISISLLEKKTVME